MERKNFFWVYCAFSYQAFMHLCVCFGVLSEVIVCALETCSLFIHKFYASVFAYYVIERKPDFFILVLMSFWRFKFLFWCYYYFFMYLFAWLYYYWHRMKGSFNGLRAKEISLITIILMCLTIVIWTWEKTPILSTFVPPHAQLHLSTGLPPFRYPFAF